MTVLVVNAGSSSLRLSLVDADGRVAAGDHVSDWDGTDVAPLERFVAWSAAAGVDAVGHRVVHGGTELRAPTVVTPSVVAQIRDLVPLAPLHQDRALAGLAAAQSALPDVPHVACFDTAFHATLPAAASTYALPAEWRSRWPLRRFGFHGLSHAYAAAEAARLVDRTGDPGFRLVTCHLGAGASLCAVRGGVSVDTTMGFTPLEGLVMASRSGSVDPGLVLWLIADAGLSAEAVKDALEHSSGLAGLAGTADMRTVIERASGGEDDAARLALDVYLHVLCRHVAAMTASLGGLEALVFTGGVGENAPAVRDAVVSRLAYLGEYGVLVIPSGEDVEIARQTRSVLTPGV